MNLDNIFHILLILIIVCIAVCIYIRIRKIENMDVIIENLSMEDMIKEAEEKQLQKEQENKSQQSSNETSNSSSLNETSNSSSSNETSNSSSLQSAVIANSSILKKHSGTIDIHDKKITKLETTQKDLKKYQDWIKSKVSQMQKEIHQG